MSLLRSEGVGEPPKSGFANNRGFLLAGFLLFGRRGGLLAKDLSGTERGLGGGRVGTKQLLERRRGLFLWLGRGRVRREQLVQRASWLRRGRRQALSRRGRPRRLLRFSRRTCLFLHSFRRLLREQDDFFRLLLRDARQFRHLRRLQERQIVKRQEAFLDERLHQLVGNARDLAEPALGTLDALIQLVERHDLDVPADELAGKANVLSAAADGERKLVLLHHHDRAAEARVEEDLFDRRRLQGIGNHDLERIVPADDVDAFAAELIDNVLDA